MFRVRHLPRAEATTGLGSNDTLPAPKRFRARKETASIYIKDVASRYHRY